MWVEEQFKMSHQVNYSLTCTQTACVSAVHPHHCESLIQMSMLYSFALFEGVFWRSQLYVDQPQFLKFNISVQRDALVGVYGRKGLPPSHTQVRPVQEFSFHIAKSKRNTKMYKIIWLFFETLTLERTESVDLFCILIYQTQMPFGNFGSWSWSSALWILCS